MIILIQIAFLLIGFFSAREEFAAMYPFREMSWDIGLKARLSRQFHRSGNIEIGFMCLLAGSSAFFLFPVLWKQLLFCGLWSLVAALWYGLVFDIRTALLMDEDWYYLGATAEQDGFWKKIFGPKAGIYKALLFVIVIIIINFFNVSL